MSVGAGRDRFIGERQQVLREGPEALGIAADRHLVSAGLHTEVIPRHPDKPQARLW